jgi:hypothetical protein
MWIFTGAQATFERRSASGAARLLWLYPDDAAAAFLSSTSASYTALYLVKEVHHEGDMISILLGGATRRRK